MDPLPTYIIAFLVLGAAAAGLGFWAAGTTSIIGSFFLAAILGFAGGIYAARERNEWFGSFVVMAALTGVVMSFLPLGTVRGLAVFVAGFVVGMRTERH